MDAIEGIRLRCFVKLCVAGLFHPTRKVREVYWGICNALYFGAEGALVPFYPDLGELSEGQNIFDRHRGLFHPARKYSV